VSINTKAVIIQSASIDPSSIRLRRGNHNPAGRINGRQLAIKVLLYFSIFRFCARRAQKGILDASAYVVLD
jgi:hypothetical protein